MSHISGNERDRGDKVTHGNYPVGDIDKMSGEDLIQVFSDAMAWNIKPKSVDVDFVMQGLGSELHTEEEMSKIT